MRHNKSGRRLGRKPDHRQHMMRNMVTSFFENESITTTVTRAKELRKLVDKMITLGKRGDLHARRQALQVIRDPKVVAKVFEMIAPRYAQRPGGYTRMIRIDNRQGDNAPMAMVELVDYNTTYNPNSKKKKKTTRRGKAKKAEAVVDTVESTEDKKEDN